MFGGESVEANLTPTSLNSPEVEFTFDTWGLRVWVKFQNKIQLVGLIN